MNQNNSPARRVALGGIVAALSFLCLWGAVALPTGRVGFYLLAAFLPVLLTTEGEPGAALLCFGAVAVLGWLLLPGKMGLLPYICFLGWYAPLRHAMKNKRFVVGLGLVLLCFDLGVALWLLLLWLLFGLPMAGLQWPLWLYIAGAVGLQVAFVLFDRFFSLCELYYREKIHNRLHHGG